MSRQKMATPTAADGRRSLTPGSGARAVGTTPPIARTPNKSCDGGVNKSDGGAKGSRTAKSSVDSFGLNPPEKSANAPAISSANSAADPSLNKAYLDARLDAMQEQLLARMSKVEQKLDVNLGALFDLFDKKKESFHMGNAPAPQTSLSTSSTMSKHSKSPDPNQKPPASILVGNAGGGATLSDSEPENLNDSASESNSASPSAELVTHIPDDDFDDEDSNIEKAPLVLVESDDWMINPRKRFRMTWDVCVLFPLLLYLTIVMPFRMTFSNEAETFSPMYTLCLVRILFAIIFCVF
jgi:hypothetical protein